MSARRPAVDSREAELDSRPPRPSLTSGGGSRLRHVSALAVYGVSWVGFCFGLLETGAVVPASLLVACLAVLSRAAARAPAGGRLRAVGGCSALAAAVAWVVGGLASLGPEAASGGWAWAAAALFLLPTILAARELTAHRAAWLGWIGFLLGFVPVFTGAALAGGTLTLITGGLAAVFVAMGTLLLFVGTVPFAITASWSGLAPPLAATFLIAGAVGHAALGMLSGTIPAVVLISPAIVYAAGWAWLGVRLLPIKAAGHQKDHPRAVGLV